MDNTKYKTTMRTQRHRRLRHRVSGTAARPRLAVYRSNRFVYAQLIDDTTGTTLGAVDSRKVTGDNLVARAKAVGSEIAKLASAKKIAAVVFDRGGFRYQGAVAAVADGAREGGLKF